MFTTLLVQFGLDPDSPAENVLRAGDVIKFIDGVPLSHAQPFYPHKHAGDEVEVTVQREIVRSSISTFTLAESPWIERFHRFAPLFVALIFWAIGVGVQAFKPTQEASNVFFLFFQITAATLVAGGYFIICPNLDDSSRSVFCFGIVAH